MDSGIILRTAAGARERAPARRGDTEGRRKTWQESGQHIPAEQSRGGRLMYHTHGLVARVGAEGEPAVSQLSSSLTWPEENKEAPNLSCGRPKKPISARVN